MIDIYIKGKLDQKIICIPFIWIVPNYQSRGKNVVDRKSPKKKEK